MAKKYVQELAHRIQNTRGVVKADRDRALRTISLVALDDTSPADFPDRKAALAVLQVAARDEQVWNALVAARASFGKSTAG